MIDFFKEFLPAPVLGFIIGMCVGFIGGIIFSKHLFSFIRWCIEFRAVSRRDKAQDRWQEQHRFDEMKRAQARKDAMAGLSYNSQGLLLDEIGGVYCPKCVAKGVRVITDINCVGDIYCSRCGWKAPVVSWQIQR